MIVIDGEAHVLHAAAALGVIWLLATARQQGGGI